MMDDWEKKIEEYSGAIERNFVDANAYWERGKAYGELGQHARAIEDFSHVITLNPEYAKAYNDRGTA